MKNQWTLATLAALTGGLIIACGSQGPTSITSMQSDEGSPTLVTLFFDGEPTTFALEDFAVALALTLDNQASTDDIREVAQRFFDLTLSDDQITGAGDPIAAFDLDKNGIPGEVIDFGIALALVSGARTASAVERVIEDIFNLTVNLTVEAVAGLPLEMDPIVPGEGILVTTAVDEDGENPQACSLREAIRANNFQQSLGGCTNPNNGRIVFDPSLNGQTILLTQAPPPITRNVVIDGPGADQLTINGDGQFRVFDLAFRSQYFPDGGNLVVGINGLTLTNGRASNAENGAGIRTNQNVELTVSNAVLSNNTTDGFGGAIFAYLDSTLTVNASTLTGNAGFDGGGIYSRGSVMVGESTLTSNVATDREGGAIAGYEIAISDSTISDNTAEFAGGGIRARNETLSITNSIIRNNQTPGSGGGIFAPQATVLIDGSLIANNTSTDNGGGIIGGTATINNSTIQNNQAGAFAGGISSSILTLNNSTISGNRAEQSAGGVQSPSAAISNSTLTDNTAGVSGGGLSVPSGAGRAISNSIISGNVATDIENRDCNFTFRAIVPGLNRFNIVGSNNTNGGCIFGQEPPQQFPDEDSNLVPSAAVATIVGPLTNNGGIMAGDPAATETLPTHALPMGSPAINAGDPNVMDAFEFDQRGSGFPRILEGRIDIGAFESNFSAPPTMDPGTTPNPGITPNPGTTPIPGIPECVDCSMGSSHGDPHFRTFDQAGFSFHGVGEFILAKSVSDSFEIQARHQATGSSVALNSAVAMNVEGDRVGVYVDGFPDSDPRPVRVNGEAVSIPTGGLMLPNGGIIVQPSNDRIVVAWPSGDQLDIRLTGSSLNLYVQVDPDRMGQMTGLLGNFNAVSEDDRPPTTRNELYGPYADSVRITQADSLFDYALGQSTETFTDLSFPVEIVTSADLSPEEFDMASIICGQAGITDPFVLETCLVDVGFTGDPEFAEAAADNQTMLAEFPVVPDPGTTPDPGSSQITLDREVPAQFNGANIEIVVVGVTVPDDTRFLVPGLGEPGSDGVEYLLLRVDQEGNQVFAPFVTASSTEAFSTMLVSLLLPNGTQVIVRESFGGAVGGAVLATGISQ